MNPSTRTPSRTHARRAGPLTLSRPFLLTLILASAAALAAPPHLAPAVTRVADDASMQWAPCPPFLPEGCGIAVLHGDPAKDNVDVFLRVPARSKLPMHTHTSAERMVLVAGELHVTYAGQDTTVLKPGTYAYGPAGKPHQGACVSDVPCVLFIAFESPLDAVPIAQDR